MVKITLGLGLESNITLDGAVLYNWFNTLAGLSEKIAKVLLGY